MKAKVGLKHPTRLTGSSDRRRAGCELDKSERHHSRSTDQGEGSATQPSVSDHGAQLTLPAGNHRSWHQSPEASTASSQTTQTPSFATPPQSAWWSWSQPTLYLFLPICEGALQLKLYFIDCYPRTGTVPLIFEIIFINHMHTTLVPGRRSILLSLLIEIEPVFQGLYR